MSCLAPSILPVQIRRAHQYRRRHATYGGADADHPICVLSVASVCLLYYPTRSVCPSATSLLATANRGYGSLAKGATYCFNQLSLQIYFIFCSVKRLLSTAQRIASQCFYCQPWLSSAHFLPQPIRSTRVPTSCSSSDLSCWFLLLDLFIFVIFFWCVCLFAFPKAFKTAPLKVTLKMSLVKMKGKFHLTFFPFDISIGLGCFVFNFSAP